MMLPYMQAETVKVNGHKEEDVSHCANITILSCTQPFLLDMKAVSDYLFGIGGLGVIAGSFDTKCSRDELSTCTQIKRAGICFQTFFLF